MERPKMARRSFGSGVEFLESRRMLCDHTWVGGAQGEFSEPTSWLPEGVPNGSSGDVACIETSASIIGLGSNVMVKGNSTVDFSVETRSLPNSMLTVEEGAEVRLSAEEIGSFTFDGSGEVIVSVDAVRRDSNIFVNGSVVKFTGEIAWLEDSLLRVEEGGSVSMESASSWEVDSLLFVVGGSVDLVGDTHNVKSIAVRSGALAVRSNELIVEDLIVAGGFEVDDASKVNGQSLDLQPGMQVDFGGNKHEFVTGSMTGHGVVNTGETGEVRFISELIVESAATNDGFSDPLDLGGVFVVGEETIAENRGITVGENAMFRAEDWVEDPFREEGEITLRVPGIYVSKDAEAMLGSESQLVIGTGEIVNRGTIVSLLLDVYPLNEGTDPDILNEGTITLRQFLFLGQLNVFGGFEQGDDARLRVELNSSIGMMPRVGIEGALKAGGTLEVFVNPPIGAGDYMEFDIGSAYGLVNYGSLDGRFQQIEYPELVSNIGDAFLAFEYSENRLSLLSVETPRRLAKVGDEWTTCRELLFGTTCEHYQLTDEPRTARNLAILASGSKDEADEGSWVDELSKMMAAVANDDGIQWDVAILEWKHFNTGLPSDVRSPDWRPKRAASTGIDIGESLVNWMVKNEIADYAHVHVLSHSAGVWLADSIVDSFEAHNSSVPFFTTHLTMFDGYVPPGHGDSWEHFWSGIFDSGQSVFLGDDSNIARWGDEQRPIRSRFDLGDTATFSEHYVDTRELRVIWQDALVLPPFDQLQGRIPALPWTDSLLPNALNFDVTPPNVMPAVLPSQIAMGLYDIDNPDSIVNEIGTRSHSRPHEYYRSESPHELAECVDGKFALHLGYECTGQAPRHTETFTKGCVVRLDNTVNCRGDITQLVLLPENTTTPEGVTLTDSGIQLMSDGVEQIHSTVRVRTDSNIEALAFDLDFSDAASLGHLSITVNGVHSYGIFSTLLEELQPGLPLGQTESGMVRLPSVLLSGEHQITISLSALESPGSTVLVENLRLVETDATPTHHNVVLPADVDGDGVVAPMDALLVIGELGKGLSEIPLDLFVDVDGNGVLSPLDALFVINQLPSTSSNSVSSFDKPGPTVLDDDDESSIELDSFAIWPMRHSLEEPESN